MTRKYYGPRRWGAPPGYTTLADVAYKSGLCSSSGVLYRAQRLGIEIRYADAKYSSSVKKEDADRIIGYTGSRNSSVKTEQVTLGIPVKEIAKELNLSVTQTLNRAYSRGINGIGRGVNKRFSLKGKRSHLPELEVWYSNGENFFF